MSHAYLTRKQMNAIARRTPFGAQLSDALRWALQRKVNRQVYRANLDTDVKAARRLELRRQMGAV